MNTHLDKSSLCVQHLTEAKQLRSLGGRNAHNKHFWGVNTNEERMQRREGMRRVWSVENQTVRTVER